MDSGRAGMKTPSEPTPNTMPIAFNSDPAALTAPTGSGGYSSNHYQFLVNTGGENWMTNSYGPAVGQTTGYNLSMDQAYPPAQRQFMGQSPSMVQYQPKPQNHDVARSQHMVQTRSMVPNSPMAQNQPNRHYHYTFQVPNDATLRTRHQQYQRQMFANTHSAQTANQVQPSASTQVMAQVTQIAQPASSMQPAQPAQPVSTQQSADDDMSGDDDADQVREWLEEDDTTFQGRIRSFQDSVRYRQAERRIRQELTPELGNDFPTTGTEQIELVRRLFNAFMVWDTDDHPGWTRQAINKVRLQANFIIELTAWHLLVFKAL